jgi:hypothetical protein
MGVYLCLGQSSHHLSHEQALKISEFPSFESIHLYMAKKQKIFVYLGEGKHRLKQNAEQAACREAIENLKQMNDFEETIKHVQQKHNIYS